MFVVAAFNFFDNCRCRVQPEIDVPGHSGWQYGKPELVACPAYEDFRGNGRALDPTNEAVYDFLQQFMVETASLFPDPAFVRLFPARPGNHRSIDQTGAMVRLTRRFGLQPNALPGPVVEILRRRTAVRVSRLESLDPGLGQRAEHELF